MACHCGQLDGSHSSCREGTDSGVSRFEGDFCGVYDAVDSVVAAAGFPLSWRARHPEFETRPTPRLEFTVAEAVQEVVQAEVEASGVEPCRPLTSGSTGDKIITRERVATIVEKLEERAKELGFLSLTIRHTLVVLCLKSLGFSTSNSTNRLFWWFRNVANETPGEGDGGDTLCREVKQALLGS